MSGLTQARVKELFQYKKNGTLIRRKTVAYNAKAGDTVSGINGNGYLRVNIDGISYRAHRVVWLYHHGYLPEHEVDHFPDRTTSNNRIENLRDVSHQCNMRNTGNRNDNTSGVKGISWVKSRGKWEVYIMVTQEHKHLGRYNDLGEAVLTRLAAEQCLGWEGCDSSSPAYKYALKHRLIRST